MMHTLNDSSYTFMEWAYQEWNMHVSKLEGVYYYYVHVQACGMTYMHEVHVNGWTLDLYDIEHTVFWEPLLWHKLIVELNITLMLI